MGSAIFEPTTEKIGGEKSGGWDGKGGSGSHLGDYYYPIEYYFPMDTLVLL